MPSLDFFAWVSYIMSRLVIRIKEQAEANMGTSFFSAHHLLLIAAIVRTSNVRTSIVRTQLTCSPCTSCGL
jgi:hypothetical protein